jgi:hypothetical protein
MYNKSPTDLISHLYILGESITISKFGDIGIYSKYNIQLQLI